MAKQKHPTSGTVTVFYALAGQAKEGTPGLYLGSVEVLLKNDGKEGIWYAEKDSPESKLLLNRAVFFEEIDVIIQSAISGTLYVYSRTAGKRDSLVAELVDKSRKYHLDCKERHSNINAQLVEQYTLWYADNKKAR